MDRDQEERFLAFVDEHQDRAVRVAWRLIGGDDTAAEDIAQEAFLKAYRSLSSFRAEAKLATWFYRILINETRKHRRWRAVRNRWNTLFGHESAEPETRDASDPLLRKRIVDALERLPQAQREVFVLVYLEDFTLEQAAEQLGKAAGTVKSHIHRALKAMRAELGDLRMAGRELKRGTRE